MIDLYYWTTPNGHKITMFLEETGLPYKIFPVNIGKGEQFKPEFLKIAPNNRIPAMVDHEPKGGAKPLAVFESGAMLLYLAEKTGKFLPADIYGRYDAIQWTFWQMGGLGPMAGQNHHFRNYAQEKLEYAINRYVNETNRLYGVLNKRLADREFIAGDYSIADMASYPWVVPYKNQGQNIDDFPHLKRWLETIGARPATVRAYAKAKEVNPNFGQPAIRTEEERKILFGQTAAVVRVGGRDSFHPVIRGLDPRIHLLEERWIAGSSPAMTKLLGARPPRTIRSMRGARNCSARSTAWRATRRFFRYRALSPSESPPSATAAPAGRGRARARLRWRRG